MQNNEFVTSFVGEDRLLNSSVSVEGVFMGDMQHCEGKNTSAYKCQGVMWDFGKEMGNAHVLNIDLH